MHPDQPRMVGDGHLIAVQALFAAPMARGEILEFSEVAYKGDRGLELMKQAMHREDRDCRVG